MTELLHIQVKWRGILQSRKLNLLFLCGNLALLFYNLRTLGGMSLLCIDGDPSHKKDSTWAWMVCLAASTNMASTLGLIYSFGVLLPVFIDYFSESRERSAWIGSLSVAFAFAMGPFAGSLINRFGCRVVSMCGCLTCAISLTVASFAKSLTLLYVSYGALGIGGGSTFLSSQVVIKKCFDKWQSMALGIASAGQGVGTIVLSQVIQSLVTAMGWRNALRIIAGFLFINGVFGVLYDPKIESENSNDVLSRDDIQERQKPKRFEFHCSVWKVPGFLVLAAVGPLIMFGRSTNYVHMVKYSEDLGISSDASSRLVLFMGISIIIGRFTGGFLCSLNVDAWSVVQAMALIMGVSMMLLTLAKSYGALIAYAFVFGFGDGGIATSFNILCLTCVDQVRAASAFGYVLLIASLFSLVGPPLSGLIADKSGSYKPAFLIAGGIFILAALVPLVMLCVKAANERNREKLLGEEMTAGNSQELEDTSNLEEARINESVKRTRDCDKEEVLLVSTV